MIWLNILWPAFAFVVLAFTIMGVLIAQRLAHMKRTPPTRADFVSSTTATRYFEPVEAAANNLRNLFETPVLFLVLIPLLIITRQAWPAQTLLAWAFVASRYAHSWFQLKGRVRPRFYAFLVSITALLAMWIGFFADTVAAVIAYQQAIATMGSQP
ncbi:MAG TPA: MAPEG family protein [Sphingomonas sp.]